MKLKKVLVGMLVTLGGFALLLIIVALGVSLLYWPRPERKVPDKVILEADLEQSLVEYVPQDTVAGALIGKPWTLRDMVETIGRASEDSRVVGLVARVGDANFGLAKIQEIRNSILAFRGTGKPAVAYAETFGEFGPGNGAYYLATAFEQIWMQPSGDLGLTGLISSSPFVRDGLEKIGVTPRLDRRGKFKTAVDMFTERQYTEANRESVITIMESRFGQITKSIADARGLSQNEVRTLINRGPFGGSGAVSAMFVDGLAYRDEVYDKIKEKAGKGVELLPLQKYRSRTGEEPTEGPTIGLIYGAGSIHRGKSRYSRVLGSASMGSDTIADAFRSAVKDEDVRAILFRVDSPGGSYVASDTIWREVVRARKAGKPVVVSMSDMAASGGYFISMGANKIVAQPATLTGSIGVFAGKPLTREFWKKLGVTWDEVHTSENATMWTPILDYTPEQWALFQTWLDRVYNDFTSKVAEARNLPGDRVLEVAQGRVWTGEDAMALGLVDELGGFPEALRLAKREAGIPEDETVQWKVFPRKKSVAERIREKLFDEGEDDEEEGEVTSTMGLVQELICPLAHLAKRIGLVSNLGVLGVEVPDGIDK